MQLITDNLNLWTSTIKNRKASGRGSNKKRELYGVKKLRELILELAVRGLLVEQDPKDEPAEELLKRIAKERSKLIKEGKVKKQKALPSIVDDEKPFVIPHSWEFSILDSLAVINGGFAFKSTNYTQDGTRVIRISDFGKSGFKNERIVRHANSDDLAPFKLQIFDILMAMTGGTVGKSLLVTDLPEPMLVNQRVATIRITKSISSSYIHAVIKTNLVQNVIREAKNSTNDNISMGNIKGFYIPLPPLAEQHRIVAKVDELMALCDQLEQQQEDSIDTHETLVKTLLDALTTTSDPAQFQQAWQRIEANFHLLFTTEASIDLLQQTILQLAVMGKLVEQDPNDEPIESVLAVMRNLKNQLIDSGAIRKQTLQTPVAEDAVPFKLPTGWQWQKWGNICDWVTYGFTRPMAHLDSGPPIVTAKNVRDGFISLAETHYADTEEFAALRPKDRPRKGDLLIIKDGATIGRAALVDFDAPFCISQTVAVLWMESCKLHGPFLLLMIRSPSTQRLIWTEAKGAAMPHLSITDFAKMILPIPPVAEQHRIVAKVDELMTICDTLKAKLQTAQTTQQTLTDTIVQQATN